MANDYVEKIDLDGEQWDLKDSPLSEQVNNLQTYSTTETNTGKKWIDNKPIYRKVIDFGALPNTNLKSKQTGITNVDLVIDIKGISRSTSEIITLPYAHPTSGLQVAFYYDFSTNTINVRTGSNRSNFTNTKIIIEYTKTTN